MSNKMSIERVEAELAGVASRLETLEWATRNGEGSVTRVEFSELVNEVRKMAEAIESVCGLYERLVDDLSVLEDA